MESSSEASERQKMTENPPTNDCCPICLEDFTFPCRTDCNHWFCAKCILEYWQYGVALRPLKCPLCSSSINRLNPEASLIHSQEPKAAEAMKSINQYNRLFVGGIQGLLVVICELPLLIRRLLHHMMEPNNCYLCFQVVRCILLLLGLISYFIGAVSDPELLGCFVIPLVLIIQLVGLYRRHRLRQRVRQLAVHQI